MVLQPGYEPTDELRRELLALARRRLGAAVAPREIAFADALPHTRSGKIMRRLLRARELGLPEGDLSTPGDAGMSRTRTPTGPAHEREHRLHLLREMLRIRRFEERCVELYSGRRRSAASCTSTSARRPSPSARCRR